MASQEIRELTRALPFERNGFNGDNIDTAGGMNAVVMHWLASAGQLAPAYWSTARDIWLRQFYLKSDHLKIATATFVQKAYTIPLTIAARDRNVKAHVALAEQIHADVMRNSGILKGFLPEFAKFVTDYTTQDNGAFMLVMGGGKADGPITGSVVGLMHLDSARCTRTGHPEYPVIYDHVDGKRYKLHYTRIIFLSSMPSADAEMYDVGLCAVSRCMDSAQDMVDIAAYNSEKLGSRPARQILYVKTGATLKQLQDAVLLANTKMDAQGLERFSRTMQMAPASPTGTLELATVDLTSVPDGFDREKATMLDIAVIAAAYGMDARDLAHSFGLSGQTKADAEVQHLKTRGKGIEQFLSDFAEQLNQKVLPETLEAWFDYVDDTQDAQAATIRKTRAEGRQIDLTSGAVSMRVAREQMLENDELSQEQFDDMELAEGRLSDGLDVLMLFQSQDGEIVKVLGGLVDNPLDIEADESLLPAINERVILAWQRHDSAPNANIKRKMRQAMAALERLRTLVKPPSTPSEPVTIPAEGDEESEEDTEPEPAEDTPEVKALHTKQDEDLDELMAEYGKQIESLARSAASGRTSESSFKEELEAIVAALLLAAFLRGSGRTQAQLTASIQRRVDEEIERSTEAIGGFAADLYDGRYSDERLGQDGITKRVALWTGTLAGVYSLGQLYRQDNPKYRWELGATEQHCETCSTLAGQVKTAKEWAESGWYPRAPHLACHGFRCACSFVEV